LSWTDAGLAQDVVVKRWRNAYFARIEEIAARIEVNFDRCMAHCRSNRFLFGAHHVIRTCVLKSSHRGLLARFDEFVRTWPKKGSARSNGIWQNKRRAPSLAKFGPFIFKTWWKLPCKALMTSNFHGRQIPWKSL
jgi:hypothetical protein